MEETIVLDNEIILDSEPEFEVCKNLDASVAYFVVCKNGELKIGNIDVYNREIAGEKIINWVARACEKPVILEINDYQNEIDAVMPNLTESEYTVILRGNIPLITKQHLKDILNFVMRRHMNACKLKGGYVFKTEYLKEVGKVLSADLYNLSGNDFFEVINFETLCFAKTEIAKRIANFHSKNGVRLENCAPDAISANVQIGYGSSIGLNSQILKGSRLFNDVIICENTSIYCSLIKDDCVVSKNCFIENSIIGAGCKIGDGVIIKNCKIGDGVVIKNNSRLENSEIYKGAILENFSDVLNSKIGQNAKIGRMTKILNSEILENIEIGDGKMLLGKGEN